MNQDHKIDSRYKMTTFLMPKTFRLLLTLWLLSFSVRNLHAQFNNFPVSSTPFIVHTNTYQWSDFYTSSTFLNLNLLLKDNKQGGDLDVFLRIKLERVGITISNPPDFVASKPIRLSFGSLKSLSGIDISENFLPQNLVLSGLEDSFVRQGGTLPDGLWTIKVTAYEFDGSRGYRQVSNEGIGQLMVFYGQPPMLLAPANTSEIDNSFSPNVLFNWLPKATASIGGLSNIAYEFELWELGDNEDPNEVALGKTLIFTKTVSSPMMLYDAHQQPPLKTGFHYAWRVRVIDATGNNAYENKGYSEVWSFRYGIKCSDTGNLQIKLLGGRTYRLTWNYAKNASSYEINWRERGKSNWQIENSNYNNFDLKLEESLAYEFRVRTVCQSGETGAWSETLEWEKEGEKRSQSSTSSARMSAGTESVGGTSTTTSTTSTPEDDLNKVLNPLGNTVTSGDTNPDKANALLKKPDDNITRCNSGVKTTTASCEDDKSVAYTGGVSLPSPAIGTKLYLNGYEIVLTSGDDKKGEGLLFFPYLMKRIPVEWTTKIDIRQGETAEYGCIVGASDKVQVQGSNAGALSDDLNRQFTALAAWLNTPGSFTGTFGEALEAMKKKAQVLADKKAAGTPLTPAEIKDFKETAKAVQKGLVQWKADSEKQFGTDQPLPLLKTILQNQRDNLSNIADLITCSLSYAPMGKDPFSDQDGAGKGGPNANVDWQYLVASCLEKVIPLVDITKKNSEELVELEKNSEKTQPVTMSSQLGRVITLSNGQKIVFKQDVTFVSKTTLKITIDSKDRFFTVLSKGDKFTNFYEKIDSKYVSGCGDYGGDVGTIKVKDADKTVFYPECKNLNLDPTLYEIDRTGHKFFEHLKGSPIFAGNPKLIGEIDDLVEEIMNLPDFEKFIKIVREPKNYTLADLESLKASLTGIREIQLTLGNGSVDKSTFGKIWDFLVFLAGCEPASNKECIVTDNILPRCLWDNNLPLGPLGYLNAMGAGFIDGGLQTITGLAELAKLAFNLRCWIYPVAGGGIGMLLFNVDPGCKDTKVKMKEIATYLEKFINSDDPEAKFMEWISSVATIAGDATSTAWQSLKVWASDVSCYSAYDNENVNSNCCAYKQGKLIFDVASLFFGVGEVKAIASGAKLTTVIAGMMTKMSAAIKGVTVLAKAGMLKLARPATTLAFAAMMFQNVAVAKVGVRFLEKEAIYQIEMKGISTAAKATATEVAEIAEKETADLMFKSAEVVDDGVKITDDVADVLTSVIDKDNVIIKRIDKVTNVIKVIGYIIKGVPKKAPEEDPNEQCTYCGKIVKKTDADFALCQKVNTLKTLGGANGVAGVNKLCASITNAAQLELVVNKLLTLQTTEIPEFFGDIIDAKGTLASNISTLTVDIISTWHYLYSNHSDKATKAKYARINWNTLVWFGKLDDKVKAEIVLFTDASATKSTLIEFCDDLRNTTGFVEFLNDADYLMYANGFLGYRTDKEHNYKPEDYEVLTDEITNLGLSSTLEDKIGSWLDHAIDATNRNGYYKKGKEFENWVTIHLGNNQSPTYKALKTIFATDGWNLDDYSIYRQVYFCINGGGTCNGKKDYFIADFVFVKETIIGNTTVLDVKIADTKLSSGTDFTKNQKASKKVSTLFVRANLPTLIKGNLITLFKQPNDFANSKVIYKIYSGGSTTSYGGTTK